jgi:hypothetical protein
MLEIMFALLCSPTFMRRWRGRVHNDKFHSGLSEIVRLVDILLRELMDACPVIPLFTDERIEQEVLMNLIGMKADLVIRASLTRRLGPIKQGIKENGIALRPQSFNPSSERRYDMADESSALD